MKYRNKSFSVTVGGKAFSEGWERTFRPVQASSSTVEPTPAAPPAAPMAPVTLRCGSCGHATTVTRREDFELHRGHACSGRKTAVIDASSDMKEAMSAGWRALFPAAAIQGTYQAVPAL